jgi:hypothetical protein
MDSTRVEMRLSGGAAMGGRSVVAGAVPGPVLGAVIDPEGPVVVQTIVASRFARQLHLAEISEGLADGPQLAAGTEVAGGPKHKKLGKLSRLWVDRTTNRLTHVLFAASGRFGSGGEEHVVEAAHITEIGPKQITLDATISDVKNLPVFRDDATLAGYVGQVIESVLLDPGSRRSLHARVEDGHVDLSGLLDTQEQFEDLLAAVRRTPGVRGVRSDVVVTEQIADFVAAAIDQLRGKGKLDAGDDIEVQTEHQIVYLNGQVGTPEKKAAAETAALGVAGVRLVVNNLRTLVKEKSERLDPTSPETHLR